MSQAGFKHVILVSERPQTHALDRVATATGIGREERLLGLNTQKIQKKKNLENTATDKFSVDLLTHTVLSRYTVSCL
jgi:hypothetical protein